MNPRTFKIPCFCLLVLMILGCGEVREKVLPLYSPDKTLRLEVGVDSGKEIHLSLTWRGKAILAESAFSIDLKGYSDFFEGMSVESIRMSELHEELIPSGGRRENRLAHCFQHTWVLRRKQEPRHRIYLIFRAYDHGLAFRFRIPDQPGLSAVRIVDEDFRFLFNSDPTIWAGEGSEKGNRSSYGIRGLRLSRLGNERATFPLLAQLSSAEWMAFTTEAVSTVKTLTLAREAPAIHALVARVESRKEAGPASFRLGPDRASPWRILLIGDRPDRILEPDLIRDLRSGKGNDSVRK